MQLRQRIEFVNRVLRVAPSRAEIAILAAALDMPDPDGMPEQPWFAAMHLVLQAEECRGTLTTSALHFLVGCAERASGRPAGEGDGGSSPPA